MQISLADKPDRDPFARSKRNSHPTNGIASRGRPSGFRAHALLFLAGIWLMISPLALAQVVNGSLVGTVTDVSGGVAPGASVTLTNLGTSEQKVAKTDSNGGYQFLSLVPGLYRVEVEKNGFKKFSRQPIDIQVQTATRVDAVLQVGDVQQTVNVSAATPLLQTQTASLGSTIEGRQVQEMPLNGRNIMNLVALVPGVVPQGTSLTTVVNNQNGFTNPAGWNNYQIGGAIAGANGSYLDGVPLNIIGNNPSWSAFVPTQDAVQEFKVETNNVDPAFGRFAGGIINFSTKSGTNDFHGSAYEFFRNTVLNANNFFLNRSHSARPQLNQNQYGVFLGGPLWKSKLFFFFSWEGYQLRAGQAYLGNVPTPAQLKGNFSGFATITDPLTHQPFPNNTIPANRIDPTANAMANQIKFWPLPNTQQPGANYAVSAFTGGSANQYNTRIDWNVSDKQRIFGRYSYWQNMTLPRDAFYIGLPGLSRSLHGPTNQVALGDTYTISPSTLVDIRISATRFKYFTAPASLGVDLSTLGPNWGALGKELNYTAYPWLTIAGYSTITYADLIEYTTSSNYTISGSLTKIIGRHTLRFGGEGRLLLFDTAETNYGTGNFVFSGSSTGDAFASFLLGLPVGGSTSRIATYVPPYAFSRYQGYYVADTFQFNPRLTLTYGVRWELPGSEGEKKNRDTVFIPDATDPLSGKTGLNLKGQLALVNSPQYPSRYETALHYHLFSPRLGFSWRVTDNTVLRSGYGLSYLPLENWIGYGPQLSPINTAVTYLSANSTLSNPFPSGVNQPSGRSANFMSSLEGGQLTTTFPKASYPYSQQWNAGIEQQFGSGTLLDIAYAGSKGTHLSSAVNINQLPDTYDDMGSQLLKTISPNPFAGLVPATSPLNSSFTTGQSLLPYPQFSTISVSNFAAFDTIYHSLQVEVQKQFAGAGRLLAAYTWSKTIGNTDTLTGYLETNPVGAIQDYNNLKADRSLMSFDTPQRFVASYVLDLPFGRDRHWLRDVHGVSDKLISGWSVDGITTFQSGFPLVMTYALPTTLSQYFGAGTPRPNVIAGCSKGIGGSGVSKIPRWFNTSCFSAPSTYGFGNESRTDPTLRGQGIDNWDISASKNTRLTERVGLEFRGEFFNMFNRVQFAPPGTAYNPNTLKTAANTFGVVTAQNNSPRQIQFALRLRY
jgi:outer membrane receptor protein involved in Fe transport